MTSLVPLVPLVYGKGIRVCSPVIVQLTNGQTQSGVVVSADSREPENRHGEWVVLSTEDWLDCEASSYGEMSRSFKAEELALDLTDATGRFHAAMAVTRHQGDFYGWAVARGGWTNGEIVWGAPGEGYADVHIEALAALDRSAKTCLPDNSRLVNAMALAIVLGAS